MMTWSKTVDFSTLKNPIVNFSEQKTIASSRVKQFLAAVLHYDLDLPTVIRSLGENYTCEYRDTSSTLKALRATHCDEVVISDIKGTLLTGCQNKMNASPIHSNFLEFTRYGNNTTVKKNLDQVLKSLNKEDRNQYLLPFPNWLVRFFKNLHLTHQGLLSKPGKNNILIWDGSFQPEWNSTCVNMMLNRDDKPEVVYGDAFMRYITQIWNLRISYPNEELYLFDDGVKGALRHLKYYPDVAGGFAFSISNYLMIPIGQTFGSIDSPQD